MNRRYFAVAIVAIAIGFIFGACNRHSEEPPEVYLPINDQFLPVSISVEKSDTELIEKCKKWNNKQIIVSYAEDLPDDPIGFNSSYYKINFAEQQMLIYYVAHQYDIMSVSNSFYRNTQEKTYNWIINLGINNKYEPDPDKVTFTRFAILVRRLPADSKLTIWNGLTSYGWEW